MNDEKMTRCDGIIYYVSSSNLRFQWMTETLIFEKNFRIFQICYFRIFSTFRRKIHLNRNKMTFIDKTHTAQLLTCMTRWELVRKCTKVRWTHEHTHTWLLTGISRKHVRLFAITLGLSGGRRIRGRSRRSLRCHVGHWEVTKRSHGHREVNRVIGKHVFEKSVSQKESKTRRKKLAATSVHELKSVIWRYTDIKINNSEFISIHCWS